MPLKPITQPEFMLGWVNMHSCVWHLHHPRWRLRVWKESSASMTAMGWDPWLPQCHVFFEWVLYSLTKEQPWDVLCLDFLSGMLKQFIDPNCWTFGKPPKRCYIIRCIYMVIAGFDTDLQTFFQKLKILEFFQYEKRSKPTEKYQRQSMPPACYPAMTLTSLCICCKVCC